jgi:hypothetical protein
MHELAQRSGLDDLLIYLENSMAVSITGTVIADESSGDQRTGNTTGDATGNDVGAGSLPTAFDDALVDLGLSTGATTTTVAVSGGSATDADGTAMITGLPAGFTDIAWTGSGGSALNGTDSGLDTTDGTSILLYTYSGDNNVLLGRAGGETGDIVFAAYLEVVNGTEAKVWLVQFESIFHPDADDADDAVSPTDVIYVSVSQNIQFSLTGAPSGQNLFMMFGDGTPSTDDVTIVVTGRDPINQSEGGNLSDGDTVNTGKGGGDTTLGTNSQQIVEGLALYFTFVTGANTGVTVPNLDQNEADLESNIAFTSLFGASSAKFTMAQITSGDQATVQITAYNTPGTAGVNPNPGVDFIDNLHNNTEVAIDSVTVTTQPTKVKGQTVPGETLVFSKADIGTTPTTVSGVTVTFGATNVTIQGLDDKDVVEYHTVALHSRVLIDNVGSTDTNFDAAFDIGSFAISSPVVEPVVFNALQFQDDAPSLSFGNLVGTGTALTQTGFWAMDPGADGLSDAGLELDLNSFSLDGGTTDLTTFTFQSDGVDLDGNFLFSGTLTGDFDKVAGTPDTEIDFTLVADLDGHYELTIEGGFGSTVTLDTADGALKAGGPDAVQTLVVPKPPADPVAEIVFFSANPLADPASIQADLDLTEPQLEAAHPSYIDFARAMNVSTSGIGVANNLLEGNTTAGRQATDESFVINPDILVDSVEIFVDNSVQGYAPAPNKSAEELYYRVFYSDDGDANTADVTDYILVDDPLGLANKGQAVSFVVDGGTRQIDAVQLTMGFGDVKIPHIVFSVETTSLASDILLDFTATIHDGDDDLTAPATPVTADFSAVLYTNELTGTFDFVLAGTASQSDAFNVDLSSDLDTYQVTGFDASTGLRDTFVLVGDATATVDDISLINGGADSQVTIGETSGDTTTITVMGVTDLTSADFVFG